jgi:hypothetical protein
VAEWRRFAILARALLRCALTVGTRVKGRPDDWRAIDEWLQVPIELAPTAEYGRLLLVSALNHWHSRSTGNTIVAIAGSRIVMRPYSGYLFGIIGLQVAYAITAARNCLVCFHCAEFYTPKNRPRTGSRNFCSSCQRLKKPQLYAMRDLRARQGHR